YAVSTIGDNGLIGEMSAPVRATPAYEITSATLLSQAEQTPVVLRYDLAVSVEALVTIEGVTGGDTPVSGILAQASLVPADELPDNAPWVALESREASAEGDLYTGTLRPVQPGEYTVTVRFSADAGETWIYASSEAPLTVEAPHDTEAPTTPANFAVTRAAPGTVVLNWNAADAENVRAYLVYRDGALVAEIRENSYTDTTAVEGATYTYSVAAVDAAYNVSDQATTNPVFIERGKIAVTFLVNVPPTTNSDVYIAGDLGSAEYPLWDPAGVVLAPAGENQWAVTLQFSEGVNIVYKFVRGGWEAVEKGENCEEIADRSLSINLDQLGEPLEDGTYVVEHTVAKWRDLDGCP
ncbi:MAG: hypothetical protein SF029_13800, partial [bacterium]|nr:hypothetical protein [bacterium]